MPVQKLDAAFCLAAQCEPGKRRTDYYDEIVRGFVLECRRGGGKTYYLSMNTRGSRKPVKIAAYGDVTFDQAKKKAMQLRAEFVLGGDPAAKRKAERSIPLYRELAAMHLADAKLTARSYDTIEGNVRKHLLPAFGRRRVDEVDGQAVSRWLADKREAGLAAATVLKLKMTLSRSYELGARWGVAGCDRNPTKGVRLPPVNNARQVFVDAEQAERLVAAAARTRNPLLAPIVRLLLLTGMRVSELLSARWRDLDVEGRRLFVPTSKTGRSRHVPLARAALDVIGALPRADGAVWLFPNPADPSRHLTTINHAFQTAREAAGLPGLHVHDLRHSAASAMVAAGVDLYAVGKVLGHANVASTARYSHFKNDALLAAVEAGAARLDAAR